jgi:hypothetical protein
MANVGRCQPHLIGVLLAGSALLLAGCVAGSGGATNPPSQAVVITAEPASQTVPIDRPATFTVAATGTPPLSYKWSRNGAEIPGATSASYTTPTVALSDNGSRFQVTVSNASSSATSNTAILTAGPRAPAIGDLRYLLWQQVTVPWNSGGEPVQLGFTEEWVTNAVGTPLAIGSTNVQENDCTWVASVLFLPPNMTGLDMYYQWDNTNYTPYASYLESVTAPNVVIDSVDLEPACTAIGVAWVQTTQTGGFDYKMESVPPSRLQATVAADGAASRIVTAATFDDASGNAVLISYGWQGDTTTVYEAQTVIASPVNVQSAATTLAKEGYFISAFGGDDTFGYILIGMRVQGDTLPRPTDGYADAPSTSETVPFTTVVWFSEPSPSGVGAQIGEQ